MQEEPYVYACNGFHYAVHAEDKKKADAAIAHMRDATHAEFTYVGRFWLDQSRVTGTCEVLV